MSSKAISYFPDGITRLTGIEQRCSDTLPLKVVGTASDEALLIGVGKGSKEALGQLYDGLAASLHNVANRILRDTGEAEDLVHEIFLEIYRHAHQFDPAKGSARTWIFCLATNRALNRRQYLNSRKHYHSEHLVESLLRPSQNVNPEQVSVDSLTAQRLREVLSDVLSHEQRLVLEQHLYFGWTFREIAEKTGAPLGTVLARYRRGCERLRTHLSQQKDSHRE